MQSYLTPTKEQHTTVRANPMPFRKVLEDPASNMHGKIQNSTLSLITLPTCLNTSKTLVSTVPSISLASSILQNGSRRSSEALPLIWLKRSLKKCLKAWIKSKISLN